MAQPVNRTITLAARPVGAPKDTDFALTETPMPVPGDGEFLCRTIYLSLDPYMRGRMSDAKSYASPVEIGGIMEGGAASIVVSSSNPKYAPGDFVFGYSGWQEYFTTSGDGFRKLNPALAPISTSLGILGMPGMTAYTGLLNIGQPKDGETVVVAAAAGPVGSLVGQIAKQKGCRAVGIASSPDKCKHVTRDLGFDACVSHRDPQFKQALHDACPDGIDVYFENVGGAVADAVRGLLNPFARIPVCGLVAHYNMTAPPEGPDRLAGFMRDVLVKRLTYRGFIVWDFADQQREFATTVGGWLDEGKIKFKEDIVDGLENAPSAFMGMLEGKNFGKLIVRVSPDPTK